MVWITNCAWLSFFNLLLWLFYFFLLRFLLRSTFRLSWTKFKISKVLNLLFLLNDHDDRSSYRYWLICFSLLSKESFLSDLKANSGLISLDLTNYISFFNSVSNIFTPFNNFALWHSRGESRHLVLISTYR